MPDKHQAHENVPHSLFYYCFVQKRLVRLVQPILGNVFIILRMKIPNDIIFIVAFNIVLLYSPMMIESYFL